MVRSHELDDLLLQRVGSGLPISGEIVKTAMYARPEQSCQLRLEKIAKNLYNALQLKFTERDDLTLVGYVSRVRKTQAGE